MTEQTKYQQVVLAQKILTDALLVALEKSSVPSVTSALCSVCATFLAGTTQPEFSRQIFLTGMQGIFDLYTGKFADTSPEEINQMLQNKLTQLMIDLAATKGNKP